MSVSETLPIGSVTLRVMDCDAPAMVITCAAKPARCTRSCSGTPAGTLRRYTPSASVMAVATGRSATTASTVAPGSTPPDASVTTPRTSIVCSLSRRSSLEASRAKADAPTVAGANTHINERIRGSEESNEPTRTHTASSSEAATAVENGMRCGIPAEPGPVQLSDLRRKSTADCLGRSPGSRGCSVFGAAIRITFPGPCRVVFDADVPRLQWRDRAGVTPDFPVRPVVGTQAISFISRYCEWPRAVTSHTASTRSFLIA